MKKEYFFYLLIFLYTQLLFGQDHIHWGSTDDPHNGLTISWHSTSTSDEIRWGYTASYEQGTFSGVQRSDYSGYLYDYTFPTVNNSAIIHYSIYSNSTWSTDKTYLTSVNPMSTNFTFIAGGDSRTNLNYWQTSANRLSTESVDFHLFLGDHVNTSSSTTDWDNWYTYGVNFLDKNLIYHTGGNHEYGIIYLNQFVMPGNERWYSFEFGNALFLCLLSESDFSTQHTWLVNELSTSTKTWKVVFFHKPFFATGSHANEMNDYRSTWWKAFDDYGVDVVLNGHVHYYLRTKPVNFNISDTTPVDEYGSEAGQGRLQIIAGSYGAPLYSTGSGWFIEENLSTMNYTKFEINDYTLYMDAYNMSGALIDNVSIIKEDISLPVEISSFTVFQEKNAVKLEWITESEAENRGFIIERKIERKTNWEEVASYITHQELKGQGSVSHQTKYEVYDNFVDNGFTYEYRLADVNYNDEIQYHRIQKITIKQYNVETLISNIKLISAYPNPFNQEIQIPYILNIESKVSLVIVDLMGRIVKHLVQNEIQPSGKYSVRWDGTNTRGAVVASGIYFPTMITQDKMRSQKILLKR